jgi:hypothetical protein
LSARLETDLQCVGAVIRECYDRGTDGLQNVARVWFRLRLCFKR